MMRSRRLSPRFRARAVTLIELLVVLAIMGVLTLALSYAFTAGIDLERSQTQRRTQQERLNQMEQRITVLLRGAKISEDANDTTAFFVGESESGDESLGCDRLTWTTIAPSVPLVAQESDDDFETQQEINGPVGGLAEVSLGLTPLGDPGDRSGLFLRVQRPSDGDYTQGGLESVLDSEVETIGFQFYNGTDWVNTWDTVAGGERRIPAAVRVSYVLQGGNIETPRRFIVPLPTSDVDSQDPSNNGAAL
jgi:prepilin-type N-terminal cleavage/methylation domain-containing protein